MTGAAARGLRARWIALLAVVLFVAGTGAATAFWTARVSVDSTASAAAVGIEQELLAAASGADEPATYRAEAPTLSRAVSITNTGTREADYTLTVRAGSPTRSDLPAAVRVAAAPVVTGQDCTAQKALQNARTGTLGTGVDITGELPAGETVVLCVQTSLAAADLRTFAEARLELELTTALAYAEAEQWILMGDSTMTVTQHVAADPLAGLELMVHKSGERYHLQLSFTQRHGQDVDRSKIQYRVFLAHEKSPSTRVPYPVGPLQGYYTVVHFDNGSDALTSFVSSPHGGFGNTWVFVEEKLPGSAQWTPVAKGKFHTTKDVKPLAVYDGWR